MIGREAGRVVQTAMAGLADGAADAGIAAPAPDGGTRTWHVYLIECRDGSIYTGIAIDVAARYAAHLQGRGARYTRAHPPARLLASQPFPDRSSALKAEYRIKQLPAAEKRALAAMLAGQMPNGT